MENWRSFSVGKIGFPMGGVLGRSVKLVNATGPDVVLDIREVEKGERQGTLILRLPPGESKEIKGTKYINRTFRSGVQRRIHVTAEKDPPGGEHPTIDLPANYLAGNGKLIFRLEEEKLKCDPEVIPDLRRLRFFACAGGN